MNNSELWQLSKKVYREIVFQSVFSFRTGGLLPQSPKDVGKNIESIAKNVEFNVVLNKVMMAFFIGFMSGFTFFSGVLFKVDRELAAVCSVSTLLISILFIIVFMGIQVTTSFVSSRVTDILILLPFSRKDVSKILTMCFIRIFDIPLIAAVLIIPVAYGLSYGSISGALMVLWSVIITEVFALTISIALALSFYNKAVRGGGGSKLGILTRFFYMAIWIVPMFLMYMIFGFTTHIAEFVKSIAQSIPYALAPLYPFSLGFLASLATFQTYNPNITILSIASSLIYFVLAVYSSKWLMEKIVGIGLGSTAAGARVIAGKVFIKIEEPWLGIVKKDLRIASRSPSYFSMLIMPILQTIILTFSLSSVLRSTNLNQSTIPIEYIPFSLLIFPAISLLMILILPPMLLSIENVAYSYTGSLPLKRKTVIIAKILLTSIIYFISSLTMILLIAVMRSHLLTVFIVLNGILTLSAIASIIIETIFVSKILIQRLSSGNIYFKMIYYVLVAILFFLITMMPLIVYGMIVLFTQSGLLGMASLIIVSTIEFSIALLLLTKVK
ncbi:MAG: hypothetical protein FGF52_03075 [Candidatus Brockarchaeota archaeon]|nr:hypothetical protein [Candidatus Brockarchaeota archaeon]